MRPQLKPSIRQSRNCWLFFAAHLLLFVVVVQAAAQTTLLSSELFGSNGSGHFRVPTFNGRFLEAFGKNSANSNTVQHWKGKFRWQGEEYAFSMVGTDPAHGSVTTTVPVILVPVRYVFADGSVLDPSTDISGGVIPLQSILHSPVFQDRDYFVGGVFVGHTQLADAMQRANFWNYVSSNAPDYHVRLDTPTVLPTQTVVVPAGGGDTFTSGGETFGIIDEDFVFQQSSPQLLKLINPDPRALVILVAHNIGLGSGGLCCALGFHFSIENAQGNSINNQITYIWSSYFAPGNPVTRATDIVPLSHEVAEWMNDPSNSNFVPPPSRPPIPQIMPSLKLMCPALSALGRKGSTVMDRSWAISPILRWRVMGSF